MHLGGLAQQPYQSLLLVPAETQVSKAPLPQITVERRSLATYSRIAAGAQ
jgi:hypothetical protein